LEKEYQLHYNKFDSIMLRSKENRNNNWDHPRSDEKRQAWPINQSL
jgi:hypothetical protein